jgi:AraC family transcriptional regulator of adaptative response / DNA-3-methyladenine glycosylase II
VDDSSYRRIIVIDGEIGEAEVRLAPRGSALDARIRLAGTRSIVAVVERIRRLFDLGAAPEIIASHLGQDPLLARRIDAHPGLRVPGAWDGFELTVRAILGQQVSVKAASTLAGRLARAFGTPVEGSVGLTRAFPSPEQLAGAAIETVGVTPARATAIRRLALVSSGGRPSREGTPSDLDTLVAGLRSLDGIGEWTAQYVAMRAFGEPDAFPAGDLVLRRAAGVRSERDMIDRASGWRPWRAYAAMLLWQGVSDDAHAMVHGNRQPRRNAATRR